MKMKSQFAIASLLLAGLVATGCSQQQAAGSQQMSSGQQQSAAPAPAPAPTPAAPAPAPAPRSVAPAPRPSKPVAPKVPQVKAKGKYKGPVSMDPASKATMQRYQR